MPKGEGRRWDTDSKVASSSTYIVLRGWGQIAAIATCKPIFHRELGEFIGKFLAQSPMVRQACLLPTTGW